MNHKIEVIVKISTIILLLIVSAISICYVLEIFEGDMARIMAVKTIKLIGIVVLTSVLIMYVSNFGNNKTKG